MPDARQLPHVLRLLDDPSPTVQEAVTAALLDWGDGLDAALSDLDTDEDTRASVHALLDDRAEAGADGETTVETTEVTEVTAVVHFDEDDQLSAEIIEDNREPSRMPMFAPGQLVRHRSYGYRGVIVERDDICRAEDSWYQANQTQPSKDQPWYHVLVDGSDQITYAAQSSLLPDESLRTVDHPLVRYFFRGFDDGHYERNDQAWPE